VVRTRVGYAGGSKPNPTYYNLGDHSETIQVDYDPTVISYVELLDVFWSHHSPTSPLCSRQYASFIFYHDEEQRQAALAAKLRREARIGRTLYTEVVPFAAFYLAEDYHQKYYLRGDSALLDEMRAIYPDDAALVGSTAAARLNGYLGGSGTKARLEAEIDLLGLSAAGRDALRRYVAWSAR